MGKNAADSICKRCYFISTEIKPLYILSEWEWYAYELVKDFSVSRQVLYLHLKHLVKAGFVESDLRLEDDDMRAKKIFQAQGI